ncbi:MAG: hypothetical protein ACLPXB_03590 [Thiobacillaceae bacterium]
MTRPIRLTILFSILAISSLVALLALNWGGATPALAQSVLTPCACTALEKLEYKPVSPAEPMARLYVGQCQCGNMSCVVTAGALQCIKG